MKCEEQGTDVSVEVRAIRSNNPAREFLEYEHSVDLHTRTVSCYLEIDQEERFGIECVLHGNVYHSRCDLIIDGSARCYGIRRGHLPQHVFKLWSGGASESDSSVIPVKFWTRAIQGVAVSNPDYPPDARPRDVGSVEVDVYFNPDESQTMHTIRDPLLLSHAGAGHDAAALHYTREVPLTHVIDIHRGGRPLQNVASWSQGLGVKFRPGLQRWATFRFLYRSPERLSQYGKYCVRPKVLSLRPVDSDVSRQGLFEPRITIDPIVATPRQVSRQTINLEEISVPAMQRRVVSVGEASFPQPRAILLPSVTFPHDISIHSLKPPEVFVPISNSSDRRKAAIAQRLVNDIAPEHAHAIAESTNNHSNRNVVRRDQVDGEPSARNRRRADDPLEEELDNLRMERERKTAMLEERNKALANLKRQCMEAELQIAEQGAAALNRQLAAVEEELREERERYERIRQSQPPLATRNTISGDLWGSSMSNTQAKSRRTISSSQPRTVIDIPSSDESPTTSKASKAKFKELPISSMSVSDDIDDSSSSVESPPPKHSEVRKKKTAQVIAPVAQPAPPENRQRAIHSRPLKPAMSERKRSKKARRSPEIDEGHQARQEVDIEPSQAVRKKSRRKEAITDQAVTEVQTKSGKISKRKKSRPRHDAIASGGTELDSTNARSVEPQRMSSSKKAKTTENLLKSEPFLEIPASATASTAQSATDPGSKVSKRIDARPYEDREKSPPMRQVKARGLEHSESWLRRGQKRKNQETTDESAQSANQAVIQTSITATALHSKDGPSKKLSKKNAEEVIQEDVEKLVTIKQEKGYKVKFRSNVRKVPEIVL